jgi:capsular exopolysaccharide synthesis family protein
MSRFFELLNETTRSDRDISGNRTVPDLSSGPVQRNDAPVTLDDMEQALSASVLSETPMPVAGQRFPFDAAVGTDGIRATDTEVTLNGKARIIPQAVDHAVTEHYRRLRTKVLQQQKIKPFRTLLVTSPNPQEGKTLTVLNLGLSFAMLPSFKVLVLDGDLRRGSFGKMLGIHDRPGFSNLIDGSAQLDDVVLKSDEFPLHFVVSGTSSVSPGELLQSDELRTQLQKMSEEFSLVLVDSPPVNLLTDTQLLAGSCDSVLLVARAFRSKRKSLEKAVQDLASFRVIGTVLNGGAPAEPYGGHYY